MTASPKKDLGDLLLLDPDVKAQRPPMFQVVMMNDDYTPMEFVVDILRTVFRLEQDDAMGVMLRIHHEGSAVCGTFTRDVAETKMDMVVTLSRENDYPLQCTMNLE